MKKIATFILFFLFIGIVVSFRIENSICDIAKGLTEECWANNRFNKNIKEKETVMLRLMQYNIGIFNYGIKTPTRDAGLRESEYEEKLNNYKAMFCKYQPDIIGLEEIIEYIDHDELHLTNDVLFNPLYPYKYDVFKRERSIKSKYPLMHVNNQWLSTKVDGKTFRCFIVHVRINVSYKTIDVMVCAFPWAPTQSYYQARKNIFPQLLALLKDAEYGFVILDMNNSGNGSTITPTDEAEELLAVAKANGFNFANGGLLPLKDTYNEESRGRTEKFFPIDNIIYKDNGKLIFNDFQVLYDDFDCLTSDHYPVYADFILF